MDAIRDEFGREPAQLPQDFFWRAAVRSNSQLGQLTASFNDMAVALQRGQKQEAARLMTPVAVVAEEMGCSVVGSPLVLCSLGHWQ